MSNRHVFARLGMWAALLFPCLDSQAAPWRQTLSLDGTWQIAEGEGQQPPASFEHTAPVPGLVDMATPPFVEPGPQVGHAHTFAQKDPRRDAFWYRRTFRLAEPLPAVATLKVGKAMFGSRVIVNGQSLGDHLPSFTPRCFDAKGALKVGDNVVLIRVGADRDAVGPAYPSGFDFEKLRYIPGIFDSVELILCGTPHIVNAQVAPDICKERAKVRIYLDATQAGECALEIREAKSGQVVGRAAVHAKAGAKELDVLVPIAGCRLWSPENPFLYTLSVRTSGDEFTTRFGMREFRFDPATGRAVLNGKPYFMRGSNITLYRFFEDPLRGALPWSRDWVRLLHRRVKDMHWNSLRYCIGFPPEFWYEIADEEGILIQDEFPIWNGSEKISRWPKELKTAELVTEYGQWMRQRWNHPCVVIWDATNETTSDESSPAVAQVRGLDLSDRPWDNSYMPPARPGDVLETHPYHYMPRGSKFSDMAKTSPAPWGKKGDGYGVIVNEYGWLWLNRDGTPTLPTRRVYDLALGPTATPEQCRRLGARYMAADTEFWRAGRKAAAVLHFTTLGYSLPNGTTCDHWIDVKQLTWDPEFYKYVRDSFAPVGLMLDFWAEDLPAGAKRDLSVVVINDLYENWSGDVRFRLLRGATTLAEQTQPCEVAALDDKRLTLNVAVPVEPGRYTLEAALVTKGAPDVRSLRDFAVLTPEELATRRNLAAGRPVKASSVMTWNGQTFRAEFAVDGQGDTRWSSEFRDPQWLAVDLGKMESISRVELVWQQAFAKTYSIQVSPDGENWKTVHVITQGAGKREVIRFTPTQARWVRIHGTQRGTPFGYSLWEIAVHH